jgi:glutathionylspermidine synthase
MERIKIDPRPDWKGEVGKLGYAWHTDAGTPYWDESAYYRLSQGDVDRLTTAAETIHQLYIQAVQNVIDKRLFPTLAGFSPDVIKKITEWWDADIPTVLGRMDFVYDGTDEPKLIEYNADTPGNMVETAIIQDQWRSQRFPASGQSNGLKQALTERWRELLIGQQDDTLHVTAEGHSAEDIECAQFVGSCATQAGYKVKYYPFNLTGVDKNTSVFYDDADQVMTKVFKQYGYDFYMKEEYFPYVNASKCWWIEPVWKMAFQAKSMLPILWDTFTFHQNLLEASPEPIAGDFVKKPTWGRQGQNISVVKGGKIVSETHGKYTENGYIYQAYGESRSFDGNHPIIGVWIVCDKAVAISIREDAGLITLNGSRFVPHIIG